MPTIDINIFFEYIIVLTKNHSKYLNYFVVNEIEKKCTNFHPIAFVGCSFDQTTPATVTPKRVKKSSAETQKSCFLNVENKTIFDTDVLSNISIALISQFFREVKEIPIQGLQGDECIYKVSFAKTGDTTFLSFTGENLNAYGDSKMSGPDAAQQSLLKALYRSQRKSRNIICEDYGDYLEECLN